MSNRPVRLNMSVKWPVRALYGSRNGLYATNDRLPYLPRARPKNTFCGHLKTTFKNTIDYTKAKAKTVFFSKAY